WRRPELQAAADRQRAAAAQRVQAEQILASGELGWRSRRHWRAELNIRQQQEADARAMYDRAAQPQRDALDTEIKYAERRLDDLHSVRFERENWVREHPDALVRLGQIDLELDRLDAADRLPRQVVRRLDRAVE